MPTYCSHLWVHYNKVHTLNYALLAIIGTDDYLDCENMIAPVLYMLLIMLIIWIMRSVNTLSCLILGKVHASRWPNEQDSVKLGCAGGYGFIVDL